MHVNVKTYIHIQNVFRSVKHVKAYPHYTIVLYNSLLWRIRLCHKSTIPACYSLANVTVDPKGSYDSTRYIKMNNRIRQSYRVNGPLGQLLYPS